MRCNRMLAPSPYPLPLPPPARGGVVDFCRRFPVFIPSPLRGRVREGGAT
jgi:hypothetical protein